MHSQTSAAGPQSLRLAPCSSVVATPTTLATGPTVGLPTVGLTPVGLSSVGLTSPEPAPDARAKQVLKEAVDAVVSSFAKHTQGYGRGTLMYLSNHLLFRAQFGTSNR